MWFHTLRSAVGWLSVSSGLAAVSGIISGCGRSIIRHRRALQCSWRSVRSLQLSWVRCSLLKKSQRYFCSVLLASPLVYGWRTGQVIQVNYDRILFPLIVVDDNCPNLKFSTFAFSFYPFIFHFQRDVNRLMHWRSDAFRRAEADDRAAHRVDLQTLAGFNVELH